MCCGEQLQIKNTYLFFTNISDYFVSNKKVRNIRQRRILSSNPCQEFSIMQALKLYGKICTSFYAKQYTFTDIFLYTHFWLTQF